MFGKVHVGVPQESYTSEYATSSEGAVKQFIQKSSHYLSGREGKVIMIGTLPWSLSDGYTPVKDEWKVYFKEYDVNVTKAHKFSRVLKRMHKEDCFVGASSGKIALERYFKVNADLLAGYRDKFIRLSVYKKNAYCSYVIRLEVFE